MKYIISIIYIPFFIFLIFITILVIYNRNYEFLSYHKSSKRIVGGIDITIKKIIKKSYSKSIINCNNNDLKYNKLAKAIIIVEYFNTGYIEYSFEKFAVYTGLWKFLFYVKDFSVGFPQVKLSNIVNDYPDFELTKLYKYCESVIFVNSLIEDIMKNSKADDMNAIRFYNGQNSRSLSGDIYVNIVIEISKRIK